MNPPNITPEQGEWTQNGPIEQGLCLIETGDGGAIELTGSRTMQQINGLSEEAFNAQGKAVADVVLAAPAMLDLLRRIEPHIDSIVCYASTMGEHEPNRLAHDLRAALSKATSK